MNQESRVETLTIRRNNKLLWMFFSAIAVMVCFVLTQTTFAQEASSSADSVKKFNITFPVSTLGNCANLEECKAYCEDPVNKEACTNFAKSKGFYKASQGQGNARARLILEKAKTELGCSSEEECKDLCKEEANREKCSEFAKKYKLEGGRKILNSTVLEKAKAALGCTDEKSCKELCKKEENREKCASFAKSTGLPGGMVRVASGSAGFGNVKQIMEKCTKDPAFCEQNFGQIEKQIMAQGDEFCTTNPDKCTQFMNRLREASRGGVPNPNAKAFENANPNAKFCRENPEKCKQSLRNESLKNASGAANLKQPKPPIGEKPKPSGSAKIGFPDQFEIKDPQVQGVAKTPSFFEWLFNVFLK